MTGLLVALCLWLLPQESAPQSATTTDPQLSRSVRRIADRLAQVRGEGFDRPPVAVRSPDSMAPVAAQARAYRAVGPRRLEARGRAWNDIGLGGTGSPLRLWETLAADLPGIDLDPEGSRLLVSPQRLTSEDYGGETRERYVVPDGVGGVLADTEEGRPAPPATPGDSSEFLLATGVRPDEPLLAHYLIHLRQFERSGRDALAETTDAMLARSAWYEGEANLVALYFLFSGVGLVRTVLTGPFGPADFLEGELLPPAFSSGDALERAFLERVYDEGYRIAIERFRSGGWNVFLADPPSSVRLLLDPASAAVGASWPAASAPADGLLEADRDRLGPWGIAVLIYGWTGAELLGREAAEGWVDDRLLRWESGKRGVTVWETRWESAAAAERFAAAYARAVAARYPAAAITSDAPGWRVYKAKHRWIRLGRDESSVRIEVRAPSADE